MLLNEAFCVMDIWTSGMGIKQWSESKKISEMKPCEFLSNFVEKRENELHVALCENFHPKILTPLVIRLTP